MDCCNYGEYRAAYGAGAWDGYAYAPLPYAPYAHGYYAPHAHDPYARYYRYDYAHHAHHTDHVMPMDYGGYASKDIRVRRALARRDARAHTPVSHLPLPPTPPLECGMGGRGPSYCEPQMWPHYQMGGLNGGWSGAGAAGAWSRGACAREHMRYPAECRPVKGSQLQAQNHVNSQDGRSTPYPPYEAHFSVETARARGPEFPAELAPARASPPREKRPPVVPLPAFQQAFGSTEIGKFAEAFSRTEPAQDEPGLLYDAFPDWDAPEPQWSTQPAAREIKCEDNY